MEQKRVRCPRCKAEQPLGAKCVSCGLDFREYARELREKKAAASEAGAEGAPRKKVRCPECKTVQPLGAKCVSCGLDFREYARKLREKKAAEAAAEEAGAPKEEAPKAGAEERPRREKPWERKTPVDISIPALPVEPELESVGDLFGNTWRVFKDRILVLIALYLLSAFAFVVPLMVFAFAGGIVSATVPGAGTAVIGASMLGALIGIVASLWLFGAFIAASTDEGLDFRGALGKGWRNIWSLLWLYLIAGYVVMGGFLLFLIPGIVWMVSFFASQFIIFEEREKGLAAMLKSRAYVKGYWWGVFGRLFLITLLGVIVSSMTGGLGSIVFTPFMMLYMVRIYKDLRNIKGRDVKFSSSAGTKGLWLAASTLGYVIPIALASFFIGAALFGALKDMDVERLERLLQRGPQVTTAKEAYSAGEPVEIEFRGLPGNEQDWITVVRAGEPDNTYGEWFYTKGAREGKHSFGGLAPGSYEARVYFDWPDGGYIVRARHAFTVEGAAGGGAPPPPAAAGPEPELGLDKMSFAAGERMVVHFKAPATFAKNAWVGIIPSNIPHGSEAENDKHDISYQYLNGQTSGDLVFSAPGQPGIYDVRMHDTDDGGKEVASVTFAVEGRTGTKTGGNGASIKTSKAVYEPGEPVLVEFKGLPGNPQDWITVVESAAPESAYGEWFYTGGQKEGSHLFGGLAPGSYEVRLYFNWPAGGYKVEARYPFTVVGGGASGTARPIAESR